MKAMYMTKNKLTRRLIAAMIGLVMLVGLMTPSAVDAKLLYGSDDLGKESVIGKNPSEGSLTIKKTDSKGKPLEGAVFTLYKIMDLTRFNPQAWSTSNPWQYEGKAVSYYEDILGSLTPDELRNYSAKEIESLSDKLLPATLNAPANTKTVMPATAGAEGKSKVDGLDIGYYFVVETTAPSNHIPGSPFFVAVPSTDNYDDDSSSGTKWIYDVEVTPKNSYIHVDKTLGKFAPNGDKLSQMAAGIGDIIQYSVRTTVPTFAKEYFKNSNPDLPVFTLTDTMDPGLTYQTTNQKIDYKKTDGSTGTLILGTDYTWEHRSDGFKITFKKAFLEAHKGSELTVYYESKLNENAVKGEGNSNDNTVVLEYSNNPQVMSDTGTKEDKTEIYTFDINVEKFTEGNKALSGAAFELYKHTGDNIYTLYREKTFVDENGKLSFDILSDGMYQLVEKESPAGYTLLKDPIIIIITPKKDTDGKLTGGFTFTVDHKEVAVAGDGTINIYKTRHNQAEGDAIIAVQNHEGFSLPETGGMGIIIFIAIGLIGIAAISIVMTRKKKNKKVTA